MAIDDSIPFNINDEATPIKKGYQIQIDELKTTINDKVEMIKFKQNVIDELESDLDALETKNETLKEIIKTLAELI